MWRPLIASFTRNVPNQLRREAGHNLASLSLRRPTWSQQLPVLSLASYADGDPYPPTSFFRSPSTRSAARKAFDDHVEALATQDKIVHTVPIPLSIEEEILNGLEPLDEEKQRANKLFHWDIEFQQSATKVEEIKGYGPQVAFVGRSNVGKSRLVNSLCFNKQLARVSRTPGLTQTINLFGIASYGNGDRRFSHVRLVDLPGYGFAKRSKEVRAAFGPMIKDYIAQSKELVRVFILVDSVVGLTELDVEMAKLCQQHGRVYQIVLTKADKNKFILPVIEGIKRRLGRTHAEVTRYPFIPVTSSLKNWHIDTMRAFVMEAADNSVQNPLSAEDREELQKLRDQYPEPEPMREFGQEQIKLARERRDKHRAAQATRNQGGGGGSGGGRAAGVGTGGVGAAGAGAEARAGTGGEEGGGEGGEGAQAQAAAEVAALEREERAAKRSEGREADLAKDLREQHERAVARYKASKPVHQASVQRPKKAFKRSPAKAAHSQFSGVGNKRGARKGKR